MIDITKKFVRFILQSKNKFPLDRETWPLSWKTVEYKTYLRPLEVLPLLPDEECLKGSGKEFEHLQSLLRKRRSRRDFSGATIHKNEILKILSLSAGTLSPDATNRTYPSGGQLYPVEIYYISTKPSENSKLASGVYHFSPFNNSLSLIKTISPDTDIPSVTGSPYSFLKDAAGCVVCTLVPKRNVHKYGWLGIKLGLIETGEIIQNVYLASEALGLKCCAIAGFNAEKVDELLGIDGLNELSVITIAIGK